MGIGSRAGGPLESVVSRRQPGVRHRLKVVRELGLRPGATPAHAWILRCQICKAGGRCAFPAYGLRRSIGTQQMPQETRSGMRRWFPIYGNATFPPISGPTTIADLSPKCLISAAISLAIVYWSYPVCVFSESPKPLKSGATTVNSLERAGIT